MSQFVVTGFEDRDSDAALEPSIDAENEEVVEA